MGTRTGVDGGTATSRVSAGVGVAETGALKVADEGSGVGWGGSAWVPVATTGMGDATNIKLIATPMVLAAAIRHISIRRL